MATTESNNVDQLIGHLKKINDNNLIDIFIPSQNRCIEVKSTYTAQVAKEILNIKLEAIKTLNYKVDLWIFDHNGKFIT